VVPALRDLKMGASPTRIVITDNTKPNYARPYHDWDSGDPKGYGEWFKKRMETCFDEIRRRMALNKQASVEDIPEYSVKTPLQRAIQILKRHRDVMFQNDSGNKPVSIVITTLAAYAYGNEETLYDTINTVVNNMERFIAKKNGVDWVENPVNPEENFADDWSKNEVRKRHFYSWLHEAKAIFTKMQRCEDIDEMITIMESAFGEVTTHKVASYVSQSGAIRIVPLIISESAHRPKPWRK